MSCRRSLARVLPIHSGMSHMSSVLIVDDEPAVRDLIARWVSALGMRPDKASNAEEALATMRSTHYDLAVIGRDDAGP